MITEQIMEKYMRAILAGDRTGCRKAIEEVMQSGTPATSVYMDIIWPMMVEIEKLHKTEQITASQEHMATRINRTIVDQLQNKLPHKQSRGKKIAICCSQSEIHELGAQMMADVFDSDGWEVKFLGGGLTSEDVLNFVNEYNPDILMIYGTEPQQAPEIRHLIDRVKDVHALGQLKIMVSGGLFNRAEGLWCEIGADMFAATAAEAVKIASGTQQEDAAELRTINRRKIVQKRKKEVKEVKP